MSFLPFRKSFCKFSNIMLTFEFLAILCIKITKTLHSNGRKAPEITQISQLNTIPGLQWQTEAHNKWSKPLVYFPFSWYKRKNCTRCKKCKWYLEWCWWIFLGDFLIHREQSEGASLHDSVHVKREPNWRQLLQPPSYCLNNKRSANVYKTVIQHHINQATYKSVISLK